MQLKRIFAIFLAAALIFSVPTFSVGAEAVGTFEVGVVAESATPVSTSPKIFNHGDDVSVKISVDQNTGISFLRFVIYFDADALEYVDYTSNALFGSSESVQVKNSYLIYFVDLIKEISVNKGELLSLNFKIKSGYCGDTEIYTELVNNREANCARYDSDAKNAYVPFVAGKDTFTIHSIISSDGVVTEPVCTAEGYTTYKCTACGEDVIGNIVDALGHDYQAEVTNPTCTEQGYTTHTCSRCDDAYVDTYVDAIGHKDRGEITEPTCTEKGYTTHTCEVCGDVRIDTYVDELGHDLVHHDAKAPTCTEIGWDAYDTCSRCDYTTYEELGALDHDLVHHDAKAPTCTEIGWDAYDTCSRCDYTTYEELGALDHDLVHHDAKAPTCTEIGWDAYDTCSRCDYTTYEELDALDHDLVHHDAKAPTCNEIGWEAYDTCSRCDYTTYNELAALGHKYGETTVIEPEYKQDGYSIHTCTVCGHEEKFDFKPALTYILGDVNGDETINDADAVYLLMHTFFPEDYPINQVGDFDGDNSVTDADAVYLLMHTFFPEDYPIA